MFHYVRKCFVHGLDFTGRARRREYWYFVLFNVIVKIILVLLQIFAFYLRSNFFSLLLTIAVSVYTLVIIIPYLAVIVRRLHDTNRSGWRIFVATMPIAGLIWLFIMLLQPGTEGDNRYGIDPKTLSIEDEI